MDPIIKEQWLHALRSDKFKQGRDYLHKDGRHCCLGVLCELAVDAGVIDAFKAEGRPTMYGEYGETSLPPEVQLWAGLREDIPSVSVEIEGEQQHLASLNDNGWTFKEIADIIEKEL